MKIFCILYALTRRVLTIWSRVSFGALTQRFNSVIKTLSTIFAWIEKAQVWISCPEGRIPEVQTVTLVLGAKKKYSKFILDHIEHLLGNGHYGLEVTKKFPSEIHFMVSGAQLSEKRIWAPL